MLSDEPDNSSTLRGLMYSTFHNGDYEHTITIAKRIISDEKALIQS